jgi:hypothetical protein
MKVTIKQQMAGHDKKSSNYRADYCLLTPRCGFNTTSTVKDASMSNESKSNRESKQATVSNKQNNITKMEDIRNHVEKVDEAKVMRMDCAVRRNQTMESFECNTQTTTRSR